MDNILIAAEKIKNAKSIVVLSGAGVSTTGSGIPDFRGANGIYKEFPEDILSVDSFFRNMDKFYEAFNYKFKKIYEARPNKCHDILGQWEKEGKLKGIVTQNIDGLHQKGGVSSVIEYHGSALKFYELDGFETVGNEIYYTDLLENGEINYKKNDKRYKPDVVLFGEGVKGHQEAAQMVAGADLLIIMGTKYVVYPFNTLHRYYKKTDVIVMNNEAIMVDGYDTIDVIGEITENISKINKLI
jgi:NAD-dependent deacetylase